MSIWIKDKTVLITGSTNGIGMAAALKLAEDCSSLFFTYRNDELADQLKKDKLQFKNYLEDEFLSSKNYKSELKWFDGVWSRFKPGLGKDKRGKSGVEKNILFNVGKKVFQLYIYHIFLWYNIFLNLRQHVS